MNSSILTQLAIERDAKAILQRLDSAKGQLMYPQNRTVANL
jgi:hypothetical protein